MQIINKRIGVLITDLEIKNNYTLTQYLAETGYQLHSKTHRKTFVIVPLSARVVGKVGG